MIDAERVVAYGDRIEGIPHFVPDAPVLARVLDALVFPDVTITPRNPDLRYIHMKHADADVYLFANEGQHTIDVELHVAAPTPRQWWDPFRADTLEGAPLDRLKLPPLSTRVLVA